MRQIYSENNLSVNVRLIYVLGTRVGGNRAKMLLLNAALRESYRLPCFNVR